MAFDESQRGENEIFVNRINEYWNERGVIANARVEKKKVSIHFKYVDGVKKDLKKPEIVPSWEIVSDLGGIAAAWIKWDGEKRSRAA